MRDEQLKYVLERIDLDECEEVVGNHIYYIRKAIRQRYDKYDKGYSDWKNEICVKLRYYVFEMGVDFNNNRSGWWVRRRVVSYECKLCEYYFYNAQLVCTVSSDRRYYNRGNVQSV